MTWTFEREFFTLQFNGLTCGMITGPGTSPKDRRYLGEQIADALNQAHVTIGISGVVREASARELAQQAVDDYRRRQGSLEVATPAGLEPATPGLEIPCSIQLSYGANHPEYNAVQTQPGSVLDPEQWKEGA